MPSLQVKKNKGLEILSSLTLPQKATDYRARKQCPQKATSKKKKKMRERERALAVCSQDCPKAVEGHRTFNG